MARFCTQCGRPLADGEVCTCTQQADREMQMMQDQQVIQEQQMVQNLQTGQEQQGTQAYFSNGQQNTQGTEQYMFNNQQAYQQFDANGQPLTAQYGTPTQPKKPSPIMVKLAAFGNDLLAVLKSPVNNLGTIAARHDYFFGLATIGVDAIVVFVVTLILTIRMNDSVSSALDSLIGYSYWGSTDNSLPALKLACITLVAVIVAYMAQTGVLLGMTKVFFKESTITFQQALTYMGGKAFYSAMVAVIASFFFFFNVSIGLVLFLVGSMLAFLIGALSYYQAVEMDGAKKIYVLMVVYVVNLVVVYFAGRIFADEILAVFGVSLKTLSNWLS